MDVCLLNDSFPPVIDGVANTVMNYARILTENELATVQVATPRYPDVDYSGYPYDVIPYPSISIGRLVEGYRAGNPFTRAAVDALSEAGPDIIHSHCPIISTIVARRLRRKTKAPLILTYHTKFDFDLAESTRNPLLRREFLRFLVSNVAACDEVWAVSRGAGENLESLGYKGEWRVVENGVDFPRGKAEEAFVREALSDYDLPQDAPVYLFVGRLMKYKGIPMLLDAALRMKEQGEDFRLVIIGGGADEKAIRSMADRYQLGDRVIFTGMIHDREVLRAWNTRADLFLFPSTYDTNGIVVREAAACGLASMLIRESCAAEGVTDDKNGFLVDEDARSIAELLIRIGHDREHLSSVGKNAMNELYMSWEDSVRNAYRLYEEILEKKNAGFYDNSERADQ